jgi:hypothetical protein
MYAMLAWGATRPRSDEIAANCCAIEVAFARASRQSPKVQNIGRKSD